jgi:hypothetical protein
VGGTGGIEVTSEGLGSTIGKGALGAALALSLVAGMAGPASAQTSRAWDLKETPYEQKNVAARIGSNVRDGLVGVFDNAGQALFSSVALISPYGGLARKLVTFTGDVVGLVDDNPVTRHVLDGVLSRHLLRFGEGARGTPAAVAWIHDQDDWNVPTPGRDVYVGRAWFRPDAYLSNSVLATVGAVVVSDLILRPVGNVITIFGARQMGGEMDEWGLDLIEQAAKVRFL